MSDVLCTIIVYVLNKQLQVFCLASMREKRDSLSDGLCRRADSFTAPINSAHSHILFLCRRKVVTIASDKHEHGCILAAEGGPFLGHDAPSP